MGLFGNKDIDKISKEKTPVIKLDDEPVKTPIGLAGVARVLDGESSSIEMDFNDFVSESNKNVNNVTLNYTNLDSTQADTFRKNLDNYKDAVNNATRWGIPPEIIVAIMSQESSMGTQSNRLMAVVFGENDEVPFEVYDFNSNKMVKIVLTNNPDNPNYKDCDLRITEQDLLNPKTAISIGTAILAKEVNNFNGNLSAAIQSYNNGSTRVNDMMRKHGEVSTVSKNYTDVSWYNDAKEVIGSSKVDPNYLTNIISKINVYNQTGNDIILKYYDKNTNSSKEIKYNYQSSN